jgi:tRNA threonylcarbamoyladenosine biosynthesis protein TsaB
MALILSIETSTNVCSVALHQDAQVIGIYELFTEKSHASAITLLIDQLLNNAGYQLADVSAIAVSKGPGSYTGLRIGVATAKGLCYALDKPLLSVSTLKAMAYGLNKHYPIKDFLFCPMIDARRMEVYCEVFNSELESILSVDARIINEHSFGELLASHPVVFFGNGAAKCKPLLSHQSNALFIDDVYPSARFTGVLAYGNYLNNNFENIAYFEPFYLKEFFYKKA